MACAWSLHITGGKLGIGVSGGLGVWGYGLGSCLLGFTLGLGKAWTEGAKRKQTRADGQHISSKFSIAEFVSMLDLLMMTRPSDIIRISQIIKHSDPC